MLCAAGPAALAFSDLDGSVIQVGRPLAMDSDGPRPPKEYYVNLGSRDGLSPGEVLQVTRQVPVVDAMGGGDWHLLKVVMGEMEVVLVGETASLTRELRVREPAQLPPLDYQTFMVGDKVSRRAGLPSGSP